MNEGNCREYGGCCFFHPKEVVVGVCHLCLNERLLVIAAKHGVKSKSSKFGSKYEHNSKRISNPSNNSYHQPKSYVTLPKLLAIASFFSRRDRSHGHRHRSRRRESDHHDLFGDANNATSSSLEEEDSFISIKFGDNGVASWDKTSSTGSKVSLEQHSSSLSWGGQTTVKDATIKGSDCNNSNKSVVQVEHADPSWQASLRWRKRIGQLLQVIRWNKSGKADADSKVVKVARNDKGWMRTSKGITKE